MLLSASARAPRDRERLAMPARARAHCRTICSATHVPPRLTGGSFRRRANCKRRHVLHVEPRTPAQHGIDVVRLARRRTAPKRVQGAAMSLSPVSCRNSGRPRLLPHPSAGTAHLTSAACARAGRPASAPRDFSRLEVAAPSRADTGCPIRRGICDVREDCRKVRLPMSQHGLHFPASIHETLSASHRHAGWSQPTLVPKLPRCDETATEGSSHTRLTPPAASGWRGLG